MDKQQPPKKIKRLVRGVLEELPDARVVYRHRPSKVAIDVICLTPEEYKERIEAQTVITEAVREGVELVV